jgi:uncharacterized RDD family membrane protein YckC
MSTGFSKIGSDSQLQDHWIKRLVAFIIDSIIVLVGTLIIAAIILIPLAVATLTTGWPWWAFHPFTTPFFMGILSVLYFAVLESWYGWTFGKKIMNLKVTKTSGQKPSLDATFIRNISKIHLLFVLLDVIVGLAMVGDPHQKATDRAAGTTVALATTPTTTPPPQPPSS